MDRDREHARQRPEPEGEDEDHRVDQFGHGARDLRHPARGEVGKGVRREVARAREAEDERARGAEQGAEKSDDDGVEQQRQPFRQRPEPFPHVIGEMLGADAGQRVRDIVGEVGQALGESREVDLADLERQDEGRREGGREQDLFRAAGAPHRLARILEDHDRVVQTVACRLD